MTKLKNPEPKGPSMGQESNSKRNASLDERKQRAAGRHGRTGQHAPGRDAITDASAPTAGGAFGRDAKANRENTALRQGAGGGPTQKRRA
jgi:hypothetical protein